MRQVWIKLRFKHFIQSNLCECIVFACEKWFDMQDFTSFEKDKSNSVGAMNTKS